MGRRGTWATAQADRERAKAKTLNPIWRGVGCIMVIVMAGFGWLFAAWFLEANALNRWIPMPRELINPPSVPALGGGLLVKIVMAFLFMLMAFALVNFVYAILFPLKPGEYDVEKMPKKPRRRPGGRRR